jgi:hypothetical protein
MCVQCNSISNVSLPENVAENFSTCFQENQFSVDKVYTTWSISWKQQDHCWTKSQIGNELCSQKTLDDIGTRLKAAPRKSLKWLVQETSVLRTSAWRPTKLLKLRSYKTAIVHALKEHDLIARVHFCNWFLWSVHDGEVNPQSVFFTMTPVFPYIEGWILKTISIEVQKIQDLFTDFLFMMKRLVFSVR